jgi:hypothetical protein
MVWNAGGCGLGRGSGARQRDAMQGDVGPVWNAGGCGLDSLRARWKVLYPGPNHTYSMFCHYGP